MKVNDTNAITVLKKEIEGDFKVLETNKELSADVRREVYRKAEIIRTAIAALKRLEKRKPFFRHDVNGIKRCYCPHCQEEYGLKEELYDGQGHCTACGQAISWREDDDE